MIVRMGYAIFRIAKRKTGSSAAAMSRHALREVDVPNAVAGAPRPQVLTGARTTAELMQRLRAGITWAKAHGGRQGFTKASTPVLDILVTTSADDAARMGKAGQDEYFKRALRFIAEKFGGRENVLLAAVHRDEMTPHMQVLVMPLDRVTNRFAASQMIGGPMGLSAMQDAFWAACGEPHGLLRGQKGSRAKHVPIKHLYQAMEAGAKVPQYVDVPPAPGMTDRLKSDYATKKAAHEDAIAENERIKKKIAALAKTGKMMHPKMIARQAERYREAVRLESINKTQADQAASDKQSAQQLYQASTNLEKQAKDLLKATIEVEDKTELAKLLDKSTKKWSREYVSQLAQKLGIDLVAGKPLLDQIRRAGKAQTMLGAFQLIERLDPDAVAQVQRMAPTQQQVPRERGGG